MKRQTITWLRVCAIVFVGSGLVFYLNWDYVQDIKDHLFHFRMKSHEEYVLIMPRIRNLTGGNAMRFAKNYNILNAQIDLRIIVIVYNRPKSLTRLLESLNEARYGNDNVKLEVWIDRSVDGIIHPGTLKAARNFTFVHGIYSIFLHRKHVGICGQWLSTWKPEMGSKEIAVILEDDLTVSPYFYTYLKAVHKKYDAIPYINGYALQGISIQHNNGNAILQVPEDNRVYLYPVVGTWGFSPNHVNWIKFVNWFHSARKDIYFNPYVPGNIVTDWYKVFQKRGKADGVWSIWHIYYAWKNNEYSLYSNFEGHKGLATSWKDAGLHYTGEDTQPSNLLLDQWEKNFEILPDVPIKLDISGQVELY